MENEQSGDRLSNTLTVYWGWGKIVDGSLSKAHDATLAQFYILSSLRQKGALSIRSLSHILELKYSTIAEAVQSLAQRDCITKNPSPFDSRVTLVEITPTGSRLLDQLDKTLIDTVAEIWGELERDERRKGFMMYYESLKRINKVRTFNGLVRGDSGFIIMISELNRCVKGIAREEGVTPLQARLLVFLEKAQPLRPVDTSFQLVEKPYDISKAVAALQKRGLIERTEGLSKREVLLRLTNVGMAKAAALRERLESVLAERFRPEDTDLAHLDALNALLLEKLHQKSAIR